MKADGERIVLHFDYDCFYASVFENEKPALKSLPLGIKQKSILATCNYVARARGVKKLQLISDAQKICPDLVLMNGEDLTRFRDVSKRLWSFLRAHSWNNRVERLGLDEVFLDVTDIISYNQGLLNPHALATSFFQLSDRDLEKGFSFDGSSFSGCVQPKAAMSPTDTVEPSSSVADPLHARLMLASHLAGYLRSKLDEDFGYTSSVGISTNKTLAKLAGSVNKPRNQTTLLPVSETTIQDFMDSHQLRKVPGIGSRIGHLIQRHMLSLPPIPNLNSHDEAEKARVTVREVREFPNMSRELLERILDRPGAERGAGDKIWNFIHGIDGSEVKIASDVPTQISIEETWAARPLHSPSQITPQLQALAVSLIRRMRVDLTASDSTDVPVKGDKKAEDNVPEQQQQQQQQHWIAKPKTIRLLTRVMPTSSATFSSSSSTTTTNNNNNNQERESLVQTSRSQPMPSFILQLNQPIDVLATRLVNETLLPLFRRIHGGSSTGGWKMYGMNVCVANMIHVAGDRGARSISHMFRTQEHKLREFTVYDCDDNTGSTSPPPSQQPPRQSSILTTSSSSSSLPTKRPSPAPFTTRTSSSPSSGDPPPQPPPPANPITTLLVTHAKNPAAENDHPLSSPQNATTTTTISTARSPKRQRLEKEKDEEEKTPVVNITPNGTKKQNNHTAAAAAIPNAPSSSPPAFFPEEYEGGNRLFNDDDDEEGSSSSPAAILPDEQQQQQQHQDGHDDEAHNEKKKNNNNNNNPQIQVTVPVDEEEEEPPEEEPGVVPFFSSSSPNDDDDNDASSSSTPCPICGCMLPDFAMAAHWRFHEMND